MSFWAFNGVGLGLLLPNAQSLIADYFSGGAACHTNPEGNPTPCLSPHLVGTPVSLRGAPALSRGKAFGALYLTSAIGGMLGALFATNMGHTRPLGIEGWRAAFIIGGRQQVCKPSCLDGTQRPVTQSPSL